MQPKVSVIIPTYKRPKLVLRAVESVLKQTYAAFEVIVMDDSRDDATKEAMAILTDPRVRYIHNEKQRYLADNRNEGVLVSDPASKFIAFLDDDDEYLSDFLARTTEEFEKDLELMVVSTDSELRRFDGTFLRRYPCEKKIFWKAACGGGNVLRREVFSKFNYWYDPDVLFEDLDFGVRLQSAHKWKGIGEVLRIYYGYPQQQGDSLSTANMKMSKERIDAFWNKNKQIYIDAGPTAVAWAKLLTAKWLMRASHIKEGRRYMREALSESFEFRSLSLYVIALVSPRSFVDMRLMVLKNRIKGILGRFSSHR